MANYDVKGYIKDSNSYYFKDATARSSITTINNKIGTLPSSITGTTIGDKLQTLNGKITTVDDKIPFSFGVDANGNYGYKKAGADTVTPFKTVGIRSNNITANGTYTASTDISKDGYSSVTVAVPNDTQTKTVTAGDTNIEVVPDSGYIGLNKVTISPTPTKTLNVTPKTTKQIIQSPEGYFFDLVNIDRIYTETKSVTPTTSSQTVNPQNGYFLSSVTVNAIQTETKTATPSTSSQTIKPSSGKYLSSVSISAIQTETKTATPSTSQQTITPSSGKYLSSVTVKGILTQTKTITASYNSNVNVVPVSSQYFLTKVTVKPYEHTEVFTNQSNPYRYYEGDDGFSFDVDLTQYHNYRYLQLYFEKRN